MKNRNGWNRKDGTEGLTKKKKKVCIPAEAGVFFCHFFGQPQGFASRIALPRESMAASRIALPQLSTGLRAAAGVLTAYAMPKNGF